MKSGEVPDLARVVGALPPDRMYTFAPISTYYAYVEIEKKRVKVKPKQPRARYYRVWGTRSYRIIKIETPEQYTFGMQVKHTCPNWGFQRDSIPLAAGGK